MYLHHTSGLKLKSCKICSSRSPIQITAHGGVILVRMAALLSCLKKSSNDQKYCSLIRIQLNSLGGL